MKHSALLALLVTAALSQVSPLAHAQATPEYKKLAAALTSGNAEAAAAAFDGAGLKGENRVRTILSIADAYYRSKQYAQAIKWYDRYLAEGGTSPSARKFKAQAEELMGGNTKSPAELRAEILAAEKAGGAPSEGRIGQLARVTLDQKDYAGFVWAMERMVTHYPKKEYWAGLLGNLPRKPGFSDRFSIDVYRLRLETGVLTAEEDYMELAQLAVQAGVPAEGVKVLDQGYKSGVLGKGAGAERQKRLRDLIGKRAEDAKAGLADQEKQALEAKTGDDLVRVGYALVSMGQAKKGLDLMAQGIAKGGLKRPEDAKLRLGMAQMLAGDNAKAVATLRGVTGTDGVAEVARLWAVLARRKG